VGNLFKGILDKLFKSNQSSNESEAQHISRAEVEALVDARIGEHAATLQNQTTDQVSLNQADDQEDYALTAKQIEYAQSLIDKVKNEFELAINPASLTIKDLFK
jgi:hypothetical protein